MTTEAATATEKLLYAFTDSSGYAYFPQYINIKSFGPPWISDETRVEIVIRVPEHTDNTRVVPGLLSKITVSRDTAVSMAYAILRELGEDLVRGAK